MQSALRPRISAVQRLLQCGSRSRCLFHTVPRRSQNHDAHPIDGYTADLLDAPLYSITPRTRSAPEPPPTDELPKTEEEERIAKARVVFGSRLAGPGERRKAIDAASTEIAGVLVPPKPEEPDNCCMSGCVNCVWDQFRDEFEEWAAKSAEARTKTREVGGALRDDTAEPDIQTDMFADIPVGIREFMRTEKKLKERHRLEAEREAAGGR